MKKILLIGALSAFVCASAMADGVYTETETVTTYERVGGCANNVRYASSRDVKPCVRSQAAKPVRVKTQQSKCAKMHCCHGKVFLFKILKYCKNGYSI